MPMNIADLLPRHSIIPILTIETVDDAVPLARALRAGGLSVVEVTLRTSCAFCAIERIAKDVEGVVPVAGTVMIASDLKRAAEAGARYAFSPGLADFMLEPGDIPIIPGIATPSELMRGMAAGLTVFKFFPAVAAGGAAALKALSGPFPQARFCPTGGIDAGNAKGFLALPNVICVGGSWMTPPGAISARDWSSIEDLARVAAALAN